MYGKIYWNLGALASSLHSTCVSMFRRGKHDAGGRLLQIGDFTDLQYNTSNIMHLGRKLLVQRQNMFEASVRFRDSATPVVALLVKWLTREFPRHFLPSWQSFCEQEMDIQPAIHFLRRNCSFWGGATGSWLTLVVPS